MSTVREILYDILTADAQSAEVGSLGVLLGHAATEPYGIYLQHPPEKTVLPVLTYFVNASSQFFPRRIAFNLSAWGGKYDAIQERVYTLLHDKTAAFNAATDFDVKAVKWDWSAGDRWQENFKAYMRQDRFIITGIKL